VNWRDGQRFVFGEVAQEYERARPTYPEALYDAVFEFGALQPGDRALDVGAGTGKGTMPFVARGLDITAIEPTDMGEVLRAKGVSVLTTTLEDWEIEPNAFRLVYAAQAWHWVSESVREARAADALDEDGVLALFWNGPTEFTGPLGTDIETAYREHAPTLVSLGNDKWNLDQYGEYAEASGRFGPVTKRTFAWAQPYTADEYTELIGTHSDHRILPAAQRDALLSAVHDVIDAHGGHVEVNYTTFLYMTRRI
jgi:hypothetical protein